MATKCLALVAGLVFLEQIKAVTIISVKDMIICMNCPALSLQRCDFSEKLLRVSCSGSPSVVQEKCLQVFIFVYASKQAEHDYIQVKCTESYSFY